MRLGPARQSHDGRRESPAGIGRAPLGAQLILLDSDGFKVRGEVAPNRVVVVHSKNVLREIPVALVRGRGDRGGGPRRSAAGVAVIGGHCEDCEGGRKGGVLMKRVVKKGGRAFARRGGAR